MQARKALGSSQYISAHHHVRVPRTPYPFLPLFVIIHSPSNAFTKNSSLPASRKAIEDKTLTLDRQTDRSFRHPSCKNIPFSNRQDTYRQAPQPETNTLGHSILQMLRLGFAHSAFLLRTPSVTSRTGRSQRRCRVVPQTATSGSGASLERQLEVLCIIRVREIESVKCFDPLLPARIMTNGCRVPWRVYPDTGLLNDLIWLSRLSITCWGALSVVNRWLKPRMMS